MTAASSVPNTNSAVMFSQILSLAADLFPQKAQTYLTCIVWTLTFFYLGHEFPFSIKMSHIRDGGSSAGGLGGGTGRDTTSPTDCPGVLLLDQCLPPDTQCQFILKPNKVILGQAPLIGKNAGLNCGFPLFKPCPPLEVTPGQDTSSFAQKVQIHIFHNPRKFCRNTAVC